jgi:hypothetical protein
MQPDINTNNDGWPTDKPGVLLGFIGMLWSASVFIAAFLLKVVRSTWSAHVLIAILLYPRALLPNLEKEQPKDIQKERIHIAFGIFFGTVILFFNIFSFVVLITRSTLVDAAKVFFILGTWIMVGIIYILFNHLREIYYVLVLLEEEAIQSRDQSVMLIRAGQAALRAGTAKFDSQAEVEGFSFAYMLKKVGPLALLVMKNTDVKTIALEALKIALSGTVLRKFFF